MTRPERPKRIWRVPTPILVGACLAVAAVYVRVWPREQAADVNAAQFAVLRWFHPLAWALLAFSCAVYGWTGSARWARGIAVLAGLAYLAFLVVTVTA